jgi:hypothetical protein
MNSSYTDIEILKTESFFTNEDLKNEKNVWNSIKKSVVPKEVDVSKGGRQNAPNGVGRRKLNSVFFF